MVKSGKSFVKIGFCLQIVHFIAISNLPPLQPPALILPNVPRSSKGLDTASK